MSVQRNASLRPSRRYQFAEHGNSNQGQRQGKFIIKNNQAVHWTPCWGDGVTVIRPYPAFNPPDANGQQTVDEYRYTADGNAGKDFGDWIRRYDAIRNFGDPGVTMIINDPSAPCVEDVQRLPANLIFTSIDRAVTAGQEQQGWAGLLRGGRNRGAVLSRPSEVYLIQGAIMQHKTEVYMPPRGFAPEDKPHMIELSSNAGAALIAECCKMNEGVNPDERNWERLYVNGDPVSLDTGRFITFYKLADGDPRQRAARQPGGWNAPQGAPGGPQADPVGYGCYMEPTFNGIPANLNAPENVANVRRKWVPWDQLLWFPTVEEQAAILADKFPPDVIMYAWRDHPEWIPETIRNRAVASTSVNAPAGGWQQGWGGQPQQQGNAAGFAPPPAGGYAPPQQQAPTQSAAMGGFGQSGFNQGPVGLPQQQPPAGFQAPSGFQPQQAPPVSYGTPQQMPQQQMPQQQMPQQPSYPPQQQVPMAPPEPSQMGYQQQAPQQPSQGFGAPTNFGAQQAPPTQFGGQQSPPTNFGAQQAPPTQFGGQPQTGFGGQQQPPAGFQQQPTQYAPPPYGQPGPGPTGGPPPAMPNYGAPQQQMPQQGMMPQQQMPQQQMLQQQMPQQAPPQSQMAWAGQNPVTPPNAMGQPAGGFAQAPPGYQQMPQQGMPQQQMPQQGMMPPQGMPAQGTSRAALALAAAQAAAAGGVPQQ